VISSTLFLRKLLILTEEVSINASSTELLASKEEESKRKTISSSADSLGTASQLDLSASNVQLQDRNIPTRVVSYAELNEGPSISSLNASQGALADASASGSNIFMAQSTDTLNEPAVTTIMAKSKKDRIKKKSASSSTLDSSSESTTNVRQRQPSLSNSNMQLDQSTLSLADHSQTASNLAISADILIEASTLSMSEIQKPSPRRPGNDSKTSSSSSLYTVSNPVDSEYASQNTLQTSYDNLGSSQYLSSAFSMDNLPKQTKKSRSVPKRSQSLNRLRTSDGQENVSNDNLNLKHNARLKAGRQTPTYMSSNEDVYYRRDGGSGRQSPVSRKGVMSSVTNLSSSGGSRSNLRDAGGNHSMEQLNQNDGRGTYDHDRYGDENQRGGERTVVFESLPSVKKKGGKNLHIDTSMGGGYDAIHEQTANKRGKSNENSSKLNIKGKPPAGYNSNASSNNNRPSSPSRKLKKLKIRSPTSDAVVVLTTADILAPRSRNPTITLNTNNSSTRNPLTAHLVRIPSTSQWSAAGTEDPNFIPNTINTIEDSTLLLDELDDEEADKIEEQERIRALLTSTAPVKGIAFENGEYRGGAMDDGSMGDGGKTDGSGAAAGKGGPGAGKAGSKGKKLVGAGTSGGAGPAGSARAAESGSGPVVLDAGEPDLMFVDGE
jgi:hypothetical protein